jgi:hypothetical protein
MQGPKPWERPVSVCGPGSEASKPRPTGSRTLRTVSDRERSSTKHVAGCSRGRGVELMFRTTLLLAMVHSRACLPLTYTGSWSRGMTTPLQGVGRRFDSDRAHSILALSNCLHYSEKPSVSTTGLLTNNLTTKSIYPIMNSLFIISRICSLDISSKLGKISEKFLSPYSSITGKISSLYFLKVSSL